MLGFLDLKSVFISSDILFSSFWDYMAANILVLNQLKAILLHVIPPYYSLPLVGLIFVICLIVLELWFSF